MGYLPAGNYQPASLTFLDAGNETGSTRIWGGLITAANHDAQITLFDAVVAAAQALCLGTLLRTYYGEKTTYIRTPPTNGAAREVALQAICINPGNGETYRFSFKTLDIAQIKYTNVVGAKDAVDVVATTNIPALTSALQAFAVDPRQPATFLIVQGYKVIRGNK